MTKSPWLWCGGVALFGLALHLFGWLAGGGFIALFGMNVLVVGLVGLVILGVVWAINTLRSTRN